MGYEVSLEAFSGPLDLLLHLITRQRVDIYEISLASITDDYLAALGGMGDVDLEGATGFLVVAATLLELKSARLLPGRGAEEGDGSLLEERDLLLARLVECATYRDAGASLAAALAAGASYHGRAVALEEAYVGVAPDLLAGVSLADLVSAAGRALVPRPAPELDVSYVAPLRASVATAIVDVAAALSGRAEVTFDELCGGAQRRIDVVVRFLALLELFKAGAVELDQTERFGTIRARWTGAADAAAVVAADD